MEATYNHLLMQRVVELAESNVHTQRGGPFAAAVVNKRTGEVVALEANAVFGETDPTAHGEVAAIRAACKQLRTTDLAGHVMYTSCFPCPMCYGAIRWSCLDGVYYGASPEDAAAAGGFADADLYAELSQPLSRRPIPILHWEQAARGVTAGGGSAGSTAAAATIAAGGGGAAQGEAVAELDVRKPFRTWQASGQKQHFGPQVTGTAAAAPGQPGSAGQPSTV